MRSGTRVKGYIWDMNSDYGSGIIYARFGVAGCMHFETVTNSQQGMLLSYLVEHEDIEDSQVNCALRPQQYL